MYVMLSTVYDLYHFNALLLSAAVSYLLYKGILRHSNLKPDNYKENAMEHRGYRNGELMLMNFDLSNANSNVLSTSNDIISDLEPTVIPRVSAIARIALCERAAYNISFFGMETNDYTANGEIGNAVHRITIKSLLEIIGLSNTGRPIHKESSIGIFEDNAKADINTNWKRFLLAKVDKPFDPIMDDLYTRADRLVDKLIVEEEENKQSLFRPEFTIRNVHLPLEGRLDLVPNRGRNPIGYYECRYHSTYNS